MAFNNNNDHNNHHQATQNSFWDWVRPFENINNVDFGAGVDHPAYGEFSPGPPPPPGPSGDYQQPPRDYPPPPHPFLNMPFPGPYGGSGFFGGRGGGFGGFGGPGMGPHAHAHAHAHGHAHGRRGRHGRHRDSSRSRERSASPPGERTEGEGEESGEPRERSRGPGGARMHGRRGPHERRGRGGGRHGFGGRRGHPVGGPFDMSGLMAAFASHPYAQALRGYAEQAAGQRRSETLVPEDMDSESSFMPPVDVFTTEKEYILHVALPGAKKEDVGVNWDQDKGVLNIAGVVYRPGDDEFLKNLTTAERKVGMFERTIKLPPGNNQEKEEVDGDAITAKLEDGVLVVTVPKIEREWTDVKKVDII